MSLRSVAISRSIFQAKPRAAEPLSYSDAFKVSSKFIFFPITALYNLISYCCYCIAFSKGVVNDNSKIVNENYRKLLKDEYLGEDIEFITDDNVKIEGMHFQNPNPIENAKTILFCSGSHLSYENYTPPIIDALFEMGHNVLVFNYRGFGRSEGIASENGFYRDAEAAYQYLRDIKGLKDDQIVAMGYSLGSAPATDLSSYHKIDLFLDRAFSSMKDVAYDIASNKMKLGFIGGCIAKAVFYLGGADFDLKEKIKSVEGRIFVSTANRDTTMSAFHSKLLEKSLADKTKEDVSFEEVDSDHIHYSCSDLWFHHDNYYNKEKRRLLEVFLNGNAIAQIKTFSFWRRCLEFAKSLI